MRKDRSRSLRLNVVVALVVAIGLRRWSVHRESEAALNCSGPASGSYDNDRSREVKLDVTTNAHCGQHTTANPARCFLRGTERLDD